MSSFASVSNPKPGDRMEDGTIYAGISPETGKPMYTTRADVLLTYTFNGAAEYARKLNAAKHLGHDDWRVPTKNELNVLFNNRAAIGGFYARMNRTSQASTGWYWSSTPSDDGRAGAQDFSNGDRIRSGKDNSSCVRCVRGWQ